MNVEITTDHKWRQFIYGYELPDKVKNDFDWIDQENLDSGLFIRYRRRYYALEQFMRFTEQPYPFTGFHGYLSDSYFSSVVIKISDDGEAYKIGTVLS